MRILWAIDSQCFDEGVQRCAMAALKGVLSSAQAEAFPVYVYVPSAIELSSAFDADSLRWVREQAQAGIDRPIEGAGRRGIHPVKVLLQLPAGTGNPLDAMTGYAESIVADVILAVTHARTGYSRLVQGSFVETLLLHSTVPLLIVSPKTRPNGTFKDLLFATDFSEDAKKAFPRALEFARALRLHVTLFHLGTPRERESGDLGPAEEWMAVAREAGVACSLIYEDQPGVSLPQLLADLASSSPGRILAMVPHADPLSPEMGTSLTRELIERSAVPLWTFHPPGHALGTAAAS